jgi:tellurite resistance protein TehA-like permease
MLPAWLVLLVLFAFTSVSYLDCHHDSYQDVVKDRGHMEHVTRTQASEMLNYLAVGLLTYTAALAIMLIICPSGHHVQPERPAKPTQ